jgi:hypothetical protein
MTGELTLGSSSARPRSITRPAKRSARHHGRSSPVAPPRTARVPVCRDDAMGAVHVGTTGPPKDVRSHRSVMSHGVLQVDELGLTLPVCSNRPTQPRVAGPGSCRRRLLFSSTASHRRRGSRRSSTTESPISARRRRSSRRVQRRTSVIDISSLCSVVSAAMPLPGLATSSRATVRPHRLYGTMEAGVIVTNGRAVAEARPIDARESCTAPRERVAARVRAGVHRPRPLACD